MNGLAGGTVFVVDDSREDRIALSRILRAANYEVYAFESAERFLEEQDCDVPGCVLLEIDMPGMSGLELQSVLAGSARARPIVFLTGQADIRSSVQAMREGAVDLLTKPIDTTRLFGASIKRFGSMWPRALSALSKT